MQLKASFETCSILQFTYEIEVNKQIPFLDTLIKRNRDNVDTRIYTKPTNSGECMNYSSHCPDRYKTGVIKNFLHRSYQVSSTWEAFIGDLDRIRQLLVNNNFPNFVVERTIAKFLNSKYSSNSSTTTSNSQQTHKDSPDNSTNSPVHTRKEQEQTKTTTGKARSTQPNRHSKLQLHYRNQMTGSYKQIENELRKIINTNVQPTNTEQQIQLLIFYRNKKLKSLFIRNNSQVQSETFNVVYKYTCDKVHSTSAQEVCYIGCTRTTLKTV